MSGVMRCHETSLPAMRTGARGTRGSNPTAGSFSVCWRVRSWQWVCAAFGCPGVSRPHPRPRTSRTALRTCWGCFVAATRKAPGSWRSGQQSREVAWLRPAEARSPRCKEPGWSPAPSGGPQPQAALHAAGTFTDPHLRVCVCVCACAEGWGQGPREQMLFP